MARLTKSTFFFIAIKNRCNSTFKKHFTEIRQSLIRPN